MTALPPLFKTTPAVFAAGREYQIMVPFTAPALFWVEVGDKTYYDHACGIMRSNVDMHRVCVPYEVLDAAKSYTVVYRKIIDRKPYFPTSEDEVRATYAFHPVPTLEEKDEINFYHLSDTHGNVERPIRAAEYFGDKLDFLLLNGDIIDHSGDTRNFEAIFRLAEALTHGEKPVICSRGNHDMRGFCADVIKDYTPSCDGKTYYTARLGSFWFIILDCAEDKTDDHAEYGYTVSCHPFRLEQTAFLKKIIADAKNEYEADGVTHRFVLCHNPFTRVLEAPFDIEQDTFGEWTALLGDSVKPDLFIAGHIHKAEVYEIGGPYDHHHQKFPVVVAAEPQRDCFIGGAFTVTKSGIRCAMTDDSHAVKDIFKF